MTMALPLLRLRPVIADAKNALRTMSLYGKAKGGLPDAIIIGAQKAGTTALFQALARHRDVVPARIKEVHFADRNWRHGAGWYARCFPQGNGLRLEATPNYMFYPHAAQRIASVVPNARLIAVLRDPIKRAQSQHRYETQRGKETRSFTDAIAAEIAAGETDWQRAVSDPQYWPKSLQSHAYLRRGLYADHLARWRAQFDGEQILVLEDKDLYASPVETLARITAHLGLTVQADLALEKVNVGKQAPPALPDLALYDYFANDLAKLRADWGFSPSWAAACEGQS